MISAYYFLYGTLGLLLAAYIPGMIAAEKERSFTKWYVYSFFLLPVAFIHSLLIRKPAHYINVFISDEKNPSHRKKKTYKEVPKEKRNIVISPKYIYMVFFSKLIFGAFVAFSVFAIFRTIVLGTESLRRACVVFAILFSVLLSIVELCRYSRFPAVADEITKRALVICMYSVICSLPLFLLKRFVVDSFLSGKYTDIAMFMTALLSFALFMVYLFKKQHIYYSAFDSFGSYCILSMCSYAIFAAISLIGLSISDLREFVFAVAMPAQIFNIDYLSEVNAISKLSCIYSSALVHSLIEVFILFSGILCYNFKRKERAYRVEYRTNAFRISRKPILHSRNSKFRALR